MEYSDARYYDKDNWPFPLSKEDHDRLEQHREVLGKPVGAMSAEPCAHTAGKIRDVAEAIVKEVCKVMVGDAIREPAMETVRAILFGQHEYKEGPSGVGKTHLDELVLLASGIPYEKYIGHRDAADVDLLYGNVPGPNGAAQFSPGPMLMPGVVAFVLDELPRLETGTSGVLLDPMSNARATVRHYGMGGTKTVFLSPSWVVLAAGNVDSYLGQAGKSEAVMDRIVIGQDMPQPGDEAQGEIFMKTSLRGRANLRPEVAKEARVATVGLRARAGEPALTLREAQAALCAVHMDKEFMRRSLRFARLVSNPEFLERSRWKASEDHTAWADSLRGRDRTSLQELAELVKENVQEGSNPRGIGYIRDGACARSLMRGSAVVDSADVKAAARAAMRFRLKPYPGCDLNVAEILRRAGDLAFGA